MRSSVSLAAVALATGASATNWLGFNSGSTKYDGSAKTKADFEEEFSTALNLNGAPGTFNAVRLYTNIQGGTTTDPISAFEAAIDSNTYLLLGIWASGTTSIANEITALKSAVSTYGDKLAKQVIGISIGSEDLYRNSVTGVTNDAGIGADPSVIVGFINDFKSAFENTVLSNISIGHVETWDAWTNGSNKAVLDAVDWLGVDEYPYYESGKGNTIENAATLFENAYKSVQGVAGSKPIWVTETGWPSSGITWDQAVSSVDNAKTYWDSVGCAYLFNKVPTFWYTLSDSNSANKQIFDITSNLSTTPMFNLTCPAVTSSSSSASVASATGTASATAATGSGSAATTTAGSAAAASTTSSSGAPHQFASLAVSASLALVAGFFAIAL